MHYQRHINPDSDDSLARLLRRVPHGSEVLELGPATGYCTRYLHEVLGCTVDAIEISLEMAEHARPWCRELIVGDLESIDLGEVLGYRQYQVILCADVLEHLRDPWTLSKSLAAHLAPGGRMLLSVPNIGYLGVLIDLLRGNFRYRSEGLLDRTHLRFFTYESINELLDQSGWHIWAAEQVTISLTDSEFRVRLESIQPALRDELLARPDAMCYQWVLEARRSLPVTPVDLPKPPSEDRFQVRLFWRSQYQGFVETNNFLVWGILGKEDQRLALIIPPDTDAIALRLTDRISFVQAREIFLFAEDASLLWSWNVEDGPLAIRDSDGIQPAGKNIWFATQTDSKLELDIPPSICNQACRLELLLDSPMSADFISAVQYWTNPDQLPATLSKQLERAKADIQELRRTIADLSCNENAISHQLRNRPDEISTLTSRLSMANAILGKNDTEWGKSARLIRFCKTIPGLSMGIDGLAAVRRQWLKWYGRENHS